MYFSGYPPLSRRQGAARRSPSVSCDRANAPGFACKEESGEEYKRRNRGMHGFEAFRCKGKQAPLGCLVRLLVLEAPRSRFSKDGVFIPGEIRSALALRRIAGLGTGNETLNRKVLVDSRKASTAFASQSMAAHIQFEGIKLSPRSRKLHP